MDRLTFEGNFCDISKCANERYGEDCKDGNCTQRQVWERLKSYESTGLEPEEINHIVDVTKMISVDRLRELCEADKDGRAVVTPCKPGDTVYVNANTIFDGWMLEKAAQDIAVGKIVSVKKTKDRTLAKIRFNYAKQEKSILKCYCISAFGVTIFTTLEQALKERKN